MTTPDDLTMTPDYHATEVKPGTPYIDEPSVMIPPGWYVTGDRADDEDGYDVTLKVEHAVDVTGKDVREVFAKRLSGLLRDTFADVDEPGTADEATRLRHEIESLNGQISTIKAHMNRRCENLTRARDERQARIDKALELHREFRIFDECDHGHRRNEDGTLPEGVIEIDEIGLTCEDGYMYSVCANCCTGGSQEWQTEVCADQHKHDGKSPCWPCPTAAALTDTSQEAQDHA